MFYAFLYLTEDDFKQMLNYETYNQVRKKYKSDENFPTIY